ncbi:hypothetical protein [Thalassovita aquimarina]|uniref:Uncharacterized protein n=1 Tax=Thalassovita aquimarina TaxID=2785917 RepID=A0ABS5HRY4_9RHOB|nr:hypothetical protein [Thalassovita aquimarina]MBR9651674.1 hypothetical protein [Thalassovita aquimarina]
MTETTTAYSQPTPPETIRVAFGRRQFNVFLRLIHDTPGDSWKAAQIELKGSALASSKYDRIEFFTDTLVGPIVAQREASTEDVYVTLHRPSDGIYRTAETLIDEMIEAKRVGAAA